MTSKWKVLSVDDDSDMHDGLKAILSSRMENHEFEFTFATSFDEGIQLIEKNRFDLIFLDVHEERNDPDPSEHPDNEDQRGEQLLDILKSSRFVPVIFYTGFPTKVKHLESHVVRVVDKGATPNEIRIAVNKILSTGLPNLTRYIEEQSRAFIWNNLESALKEPTQDITSDIALLAARNLAKNLSQRSIKEMLGNDLNLISPLEMYLFPPEPKSCNPADIYKKIDDKTLWMVLTPACDFEQNKVDNVLLAKVTPLTEHSSYKEWQEQVEYSKELEPGQKKKEAEQCIKQARGTVKQFVQNKKGSRFRFFPGTFFLPDCIVDFQQLLNLPANYEDDFQVVCSLDNPYREELLQLFSNYYGRIGTPDYEFDSIWGKVEKEFSF